MTVNTRESGEDQQRPQGPFRLLTVNTAPDRARRLVGRMCEVKHIYQIIHVANISSKLHRWLPSIFFNIFLFKKCSVSRPYTYNATMTAWSLAKRGLRLTSIPGIDGVRPAVEEHRPDVLV